jgi:type II secretory pathway pseudopilin PulG
MRINSLTHIRSMRRPAYTLLELLLSLALAAVIAVLIGNLVQMYLINQENGTDNVRQAQIARALLNMIAEDVRTTVRHQTFDASGLQQLLSGDTGGGGGGGGSSPGGASPASAGSGGGPSSAPPAPSSRSSGSAGSSMSSSSDMSSTAVAPLPPGIYGTSTSIEIDVSRLPRPDEYYPRMANSQTGGLGDMPSDIKTVGYYVQSPRTDGVQDSLGTLVEQSATGTDAVATPNGGLVRRSVDRAVTQYAYDMGRSDQLMRTGELIAPEVVAIEFSYYDGTTWQTEWDGSKQGLPIVVKITLAMQRESFTKSKPATQGMAISALTQSVLQEYGIEIYSMNTLIPGSQLLVAPQGTTATGSSSSGMSSVGL